MTYTYKGGYNGLNVNYTISYGPFLLRCDEAPRIGKHYLPAVTYRFGML